MGEAWLNEGGNAYAIVAALLLELGRVYCKRAEELPPNFWFCELAAMSLYQGYIDEAIETADGWTYTGRVGWIYEWLCCCEVRHSAPGGWQPYPDPPDLPGVILGR